MNLNIMKLKGDGHVAGYVPLGEPCFAGEFYMHLDELKADIESKWQVVWLKETTDELTGQIGYRHRKPSIWTKEQHEGNCI